MLLRFAQAFLSAVIGIALPILIKRVKSIFRAQVPTHAWKKESKKDIIKNFFYSLILGLVFFSVGIILLTLDYLSLMPKYLGESFNLFIFFFTFAFMGFTSACMCIFAAVNYSPEDTTHDNAADEKSDKIQ